MVIFGGLGFINEVSFVFSVIGGAGRWVAWNIDGVFTGLSVEIGLVS